MGTSHSIIVPDVLLANDVTVHVSCRGKRILIASCTMCSASVIYMWRHACQCEGWIIHVSQHCGACVLQGQAYTDAGATAYDAVDGALNDVVTIGLSLINTVVVSPTNACVA